MTLMPSLRRSRAAVEPRSGHVLGNPPRSQGAIALAAFFIEAARVAENGGAIDPGAALKPWDEGEFQIRAARLTALL